MWWSGSGRTDSGASRCRGIAFTSQRRWLDLFSRLLLTLIRDERLHVDDLKALLALVGRRLDPARLAGGLLQRLNPLAAA